MMLHEAVPAVIDDPMLREAVRAQGPSGGAGKVAEKEGIDYKDVPFLQLNYKNILRINGLWEFVNLTTLKLDNNIIEVIEGLDVMVNLQYLNLSFNNIEKIEGLGCLTKLEDLSLYHNRITHLENMDALVHLQIFSIGNNLLNKLDDVIYLRRFKSLRSLNLSNNPCCENNGYKLYVAAFLPNLRYFDYCFLEAHMIEKGKEKYAANLESVEDLEKFTQEKLDKETEAAQKHAYHSKAFVENLCNMQMFNTLYAKDPEGMLLNELEGANILLEAFKKKFNPACEEFFKYGLSAHQKREEEMALFWESVNTAKRKNKEKSLEMIAHFEQEKSELLERIVFITDKEEVFMLVDKYNKRVTELWDNLMGLEMLLVDQLEEVIIDFEHQMQDLVDGFIEKSHLYIAKMRDAEFMHFEKLTDLASTTFDRLNKVQEEGFEPSTSAELVELFEDKDNLINTLATSHETHMLVIDDREDSTKYRIMSWFRNTMESIHKEEEVARNRARVNEIARYVGQQREDIDHLEMSSGSHSQQ